jgi:hypothetical protein
LLSQLGYTIKKRDVSAIGEKAEEISADAYLKEKPSNFDIWKYQPPLLRMALKYFASSRQPQPANQPMISSVDRVVKVSVDANATNGKESNY